MEQDKTPRHILLATTGESPQVVTETLYAIHEEGLTWPDEIRLITTTVGKARARKGLLDEGHLARLCDEIGKPLPLFDETHIEVVPGADGTEVDDARSLEDHEALGDFIMTRVRDLTVTDEQGKPVQTVHASLAGGRKTMTFYLGYAMSLFGRREDTLSHVLISRGFEGNPGFWFPTAAPEHRYLQDRQGEKMDASAATVTLALIPFVRHRHDLPALLQQSGTAVHFRDLVRLINLGDLPDELHLDIDLQGQKIRISDSRSKLSFEFSPGLLALAFYAVMARATLNSNSTLYRPSGEYAHAAGTILRDQVLQELLRLHEQPISSNLDQNIQSLRGLFKDASLNSLKEPLTHTWFDQRKNELSKLFKERLTERVSQWLTPEIIWDDAGERLKPTDKVVKGGGYGIPLNVGNIELIEMTEQDRIA